MAPSNMLRKAQSLKLMEGRRSGSFKSDESDPGDMLEEDFELDFGNYYTGKYDQVN